MISVCSAMGMGFVLGLRHALDADHVAAVATLLRREQGVARAMGVGALWGVGHTLSLLGAGALLLLVRARWLSRLETVGEVLVCLMLLGLGAVGLWRWRRSEAEPSQSVAPRTGRGAIGIGAVHGLAGTAATALVAASAGGNGPLSIVFLLLFGVGTVFGMSAMTALMGAGLARTARRSQRVQGDAVRRERAQRGGGPGDGRVAGEGLTRAEDARWHASATRTRHSRRS